MNAANFFAVVKVIAVYMQFYGYTFRVKCDALQALVSKHHRYK
jgi:hypothetical protein